MIVRMWSNRAIGTPNHCWWECKIILQPWKTFWKFLIKLYRVFTCNPAVVLLCINSKEMKTYIHTTCTRVFIAVSHYCQNLEATKISFSRWMCKWTVLPPTVEYSSVIKINTSMKMYGGSLNTSQSEKLRSKKPTYFMMLTTWHSGRRKAMGAVKGLPVPSD